MESHPLNKAHQQYRRAEAYFKNNKYDEAMQCHHNAAELLLDAMKSTTSSVALESITLQHSYHLKQKDLIKCKKEQYARVKMAMDNIKLLSKDPTWSAQGDNSKLQVAIYKAINETDSLLQMLSTKKYAPESTPHITTVNKDMVDGKKIGKTQQSVVEELHILSQNLHLHVEQLVLQVEVLKDENETLKERVNYLEKERVKYLNLQCNQSELLQRQSFSDNNIPPEIFTIDPVGRMPTMGQSQALFDLSALRDD